MVDRAAFDEFVWKEYVEKKKNGSKVMTRSKGTEIIAYLSDSGSAKDAHFKFWVKSRGFQLVDYPVLDLKNVLCLPAKKKDGNDPTLLGSFRRVAFVEDFYEILERIHSKERGHVGYKKTLAEVASCYECVPRFVVQEFISRCTVCGLQKPQQNQAPLKPIISSGFMTRGQIDLIDMRHRPDGSYHWIGHFMDHWSKMHVLFPLMEKSAAEVALNLSAKVFAYYGPPKILQSDNGREFVNGIVRKLVDDWPGEITIINGRARHPQSQGLVERGNAKVEEMLACRFHAQEALDESPWTLWLPEVQYQLNTCVQSTMKATPFELVFGQPPRSTIFPGVSGLVMEEEVEDLLTEEVYSQESTVPSDVISQDSPVMSKGVRTPSWEDAEDDGLHALGTSQKHLERRQLADKHYRKNAEQMKERYNKKKVQTFVVGDFVSVRIPRIDRAATDLHRLPCIIVECHGKKHFLYRLRCYYGVLESSYPGSELEVYGGTLPIGVHDWEKAPKVSLREASKLANPSNAYYGTSCNCKKGCSGKRCSCVKAEKPCSTRCHSGKSCANCRDGNPGMEPKPLKLDATSNTCELLLPAESESLSLSSPTKSSNSEPFSPTKLKQCETSPIYIRSPSESPPPSNCWVKDPYLSKLEKVILESGGWLNDLHISAAQRLLKWQYPHVDGLQDSILGPQLAFSVMHSEGVQIINHEKHWICISTIECQPGHVDVYDSLFNRLSPSAVRQICHLLHSREPKLTVRMRDIQIQAGGSECGLYAIACAECLCRGENPCRISWRQEMMRKHLISCFSQRRMSLFPGSERQISTDIKRTLHYPLFCSCRMPEDKMGMAQCIQCKEWFHKKCQRIPRVVFTKKASWHCDTCK